MTNRPLLALALLAVALPAQALYKVVGPDGSVTYTDRPPVETNARVTPIGGRGAPVEPEVPLPAELRQVAARFPATLYVGGSDCPPCDGARQFLRNRGVPYTERTVVSREDTEAFERLTGSREVPLLTLGGQTLRGFAAETWAAYLDAAGYPRSSRLPAGWRNPEPAPLTPRPGATAAATPEPTPVAPPTPLPSSDEPTPPSIRF